MMGFIANYVYMKIVLVNQKIYETSKLQAEWTKIWCILRSLHCPKEDKTTILVYTLTNLYILQSLGQLLKEFKYV